jgi:hypothetical protein
MVGSLATCRLFVPLGKVVDAVEFEMGQLLPRIAWAQSITNPFSYGADGQTEE